MDTLLTEPTDSLDPDLWAVYGDWLSDQGDDSGGERARCISRGLRKTGGTLWLSFLSGKRDFVQSSFHRDTRDASTFRLDKDFVYSWWESGSHDYEADVPDNPVNSPSPFLNRPEVVRAYWDKLAKLGGGLIPPHTPGKAPRIDQDRKFS